MKISDGNIALIGYMGSGKTTVGEALAGLLGRALWDTDRMIEEGAGKPVSAIFADEGEAVFRRLETEVLRRILADGVAGTVLSVGGGLPLREENRTLLRAIGKTVYLRTKPESVLARLAGDATRPLLADADEGEKLSHIRRMLAEREPVYEAAADRIVDTDGKAPAEIAAEILGL